MVQRELNLWPKESRGLAKRREEELKRKILQVLKRGKGSSLPSSAVRYEIGAPESRTDVLVSRLIRDLIEEGHPIGSCQKGYFIIESKEELDEVLEDLRARAAGIETRIRKLRLGFKG